MKSHIEKPVLLLPTRVLIVPCDYEPDRNGPVKWIEQTLTMRCKADNAGRIRSVVKGTYVAREIVKEDPQTMTRIPYRSV